MTRPFALRLPRALASSLALAAAACGPQVATPLPEPPSLDGRTITTGDIVPVVNNDSRTFSATPGAATPGATVRVLNLDRTTPAVATTVNADGSFTVSVPASLGEELRVEAINEAGRSAPIDFIYAQPTLLPSPRHACISLTPGPFVPFVAAGSSTLVIQNDCDEAVLLSGARTRLGSAEFPVPTNIPTEIPAGETASIELTFTRTNTNFSAAEDVLFIDLQVGTLSIRYPIGVALQAP